MPRTTYDIHGVLVTHEEMVALHAVTKGWKGRIAEAPTHVKFIGAMLMKAGFTFGDMEHIAKGPADED